MDKLLPFNQRETGNGKPGKKFLNVNIVRGKHDLRFNCHDLNKKIKTRASNIDKLKEQIKQYQAMIEDMKRQNQEQKEEEILNAESQGGAAGKDAVERDDEGIGSGRKEREEESKLQERAPGELVQEAKERKKEKEESGKEEAQRVEEQEKKSKKILIKTPIKIIYNPLRETLIFLKQSQ